MITPATATATAAESAAAPGFERQRADKLMERAHVMLSHNFREEALRLAAVAEQLEKSRLAIYSPGEERPSELVARLQRSSTEGDADESTSRTAPATEIVLRGARRNRSQPASPLLTGAKRGHIELTDIRAGWHAAADSTDAESTEIERITAEKSTAHLAQTQVALLETNGASDNQSATASGSKSELTTEAPAPPDIFTPTGSTQASVVADDIAEVEPVVDETPTARSPVNATTMGGILAGLAGLLGLAYWRRQERKHYAGATR